MFNNPVGFGYPQQPQMYNYNGMPASQQRKQNNFLSDEQIDKLQNNKPKFNLQPTDQEIMESKCNHRQKGGLSSSLEVDPTDPSRYTCSICHQPVKPVDPTAERSDVQSITDDFVNVLETIKILFADFPAEAAEYFTIIPLVKRAPELFEMAVKSIRKYNQNNPYGFQDPSNSTNYILNNFMAANGFGGFGMGGYGQPMYQQAPQYTQPQPTPVMGANPAFGNYGTNPFGYNGASQFGAPQYGYQPGVQGFQYNPQQAQPAPQQDTSAGTTTTTTNNQA